MRILVGSEPWQRIRELNAARKGPAVVMSAYFGIRGSELLPLRRGDILVVAASEANVRAGKVNPGELLRYPEGVLIYSSAKLHGKVYNFGSRSIVGSANVSEYSRSGLIELAVEVSVTQEERQALLDGLPRRLLTREDLAHLATIYQPPRFQGLASSDEESPTASSANTTTVIQSVPSWRSPDSEDRIWYHGTFPESMAGNNPLEVYLPSLSRLRPGDWYIRVFKRDGKRYGAAPMRVRSVQVRRRKATVTFDFSRSRRASVPIEELESLLVPGAPPIQKRWLLLSDRVPSSKIFATFGGVCPGSARM